MPRPRIRRCCRRYLADRVYKPQGIPLRSLETTTVSLDQFEVMRLCDLEGLEQEEAGRRIGVSRGTIQRILYEARRKLVEAILNNDAIMINLKEKGNEDVSLYSHTGRCRQR